VRFQLLPFLPHAFEQPTYAGREVSLSVFQQGNHILAQVRRSFGKGDAPLDEEASDLVDDRRAALHQPVAHPMESLQVQLLVALDGNKPHVLSSHGFRDGFCVQEVILV
jgi:hypothetical protein